MPNTHVMLDLETLSLRSDAAIIQIAAVAFDPQTGAIGASFNAYVRDSSGHIDVDTVAWWLQQTHAPKIGAAVAASKCDEATALKQLSVWFRVHGFDVAKSLWCHGGVDFPWLKNAYARYCLAEPWPYKIERDTRTLYALAPGGMPVVAVDPARKHDALYDCEVQVQQVVGALAALRNGLAVADTERAPSVTPQTLVVPPALFDPPPVWSRAEGFTEALANPRAAAEDFGDESAYGEPPNAPL